MLRSLVGSEMCIRDRTTSVSAVDTILTNFTSGGDVDVDDDDDQEADGTLLQASAEGNITLVKKRVAKLKSLAEEAFPKEPHKASERFKKVFCNTLYTF